MTELTLKTGSSTRIALNLGNANDGYFDEGDLAEYYGNIYLLIDGQEYGSLFVHRDGERITITLGRYSPDRRQWEEVNPLTEPLARVE